MQQPARKWVRFALERGGRLLPAAVALPFRFGGQSNLDQAANSFGAPRIIGLF